MIGGVNVSRETSQALETFAALVLKWTPRINLIGASTKVDIWERHIVDSAQIYRFAPESFDIWLDIGSGGGFPGIVAAILAKEHAPKAQFVLVESDLRKATFLRTAIRDCDLNAKVLAERVENLPAINADVVSARALGALSMLLPLVALHMRQSGLALLHKGRQAESEIAIARQDWRFDLEEVASITDPDARLLLIQRIARVA